MSVSFIDQKGTSGREDAGSHNDGGRFEFRASTHGPYTEILNGLTPIQVGSCCDESYQIFVTESE